MADRYDSLKLDNQLCFPLYALSREVIKKYTPHLEALDLTYTQYIAMMILWERKKITVKEMGCMLFLDSGTLTPVLKKLEQKGLIDRRRCCDDERVLMVSITEKGEQLKEEAVKVPEKMSGCLNLSQEDVQELYRLLRKALKCDEK